ncbi:RES family NAD+ phosphorylase [Larkinella terrae]|uniref:RES domain-containing protein n=1 Tax=Larkinella terrae TaxID=2025311 RepID=A0A7K0EFF2_9BACT|nr:RES family NAD+ phosphorylase [Larkinella terrae]MRS60186.1 RES domain-containing protein [Larkinella terrae]
MLVYRLYKSEYIADPLSGEGARKAGGRWNPKGYPILYTAATPELALVEVLVHFNPKKIPRFHLLVLEISGSIQTTLLQDLPADWQSDEQYDRLQNHLLDWLIEPTTVAVSVPSAIITRSTNYLIHTLFPGFRDEIKIIENEPFLIDSRLYEAR